MVAREEAARVDETVGDSLPILGSLDPLAAEGTMTSWGEVSQQQQRERGRLITASALISRQKQQQEPAGARFLREPMCSHCLGKPRSQS